MLLGVRVGPMLEGPFHKTDFPGAEYGEPANASCATLGLHVKRWVERRLVDYVCPTLFGPQGLPRTSEFVQLTKGTDIGVYPTISREPCGALGGMSIFGRPDNADTRDLYRRDICREALRCYREGADGISLFNWCPHFYQALDDKEPSSGQVEPARAIFGRDAPGFRQVQWEMMPKLSDPRALQVLLGNAEPTVPNAVR